MSAFAKDDEVACAISSNSVRKILIVEDGSFTALDLKAVLGKLGYAVPRRDVLLYARGGSSRRPVFFSFGNNRRLEIEFISG